MWKIWSVDEVTNVVKGDEKKESANSQMPIKHPTSGGQVGD